VTEVLGGQTKSGPAKTTNPPRGQGAIGAPGPAAVPAAAVPKANVSPIKDYDAHYKGQTDVSEAQLTLDVAFLRGIRDWVGVEKALTAYLKYHGKHAAPWMLGMLGATMEINKRDPTAIKVAFGRYARLASASKDPIALIAASDALLAHSYFEIDVPDGVGGAGKVRLGDLLDQAMKAAPQKPHPILMSLVLAEKQKDPKRMGDTAETLLSLGWPGVDGAWRVEVPKRVAAMAKSLRADNRAGEAQALLDRLPGLEARDVVIRLTWEKGGMLDLVVDEPLGATADHFNPRTVFGGSLVKEGKPRDREAVYVCPRGFDGEYVAKVKVVANDEKNPTALAFLEVVTHEGTANEKVITKKISIAKPESVKVTLKGGRRKEVLPYEVPNAINTPKPELTAPKADAAKAAPATPGPKKP
jgi:hypothetical protein